MKIYKLLIAALMIISTSSYAQSRYFLQFQGGINHTIGEGKFGKLLSPSVSGYFGYNITPLFAVRAGLSGWQGKGALSFDEKHHYYKFDFIQGNADAMINLSNWLAGKNDTRIFNGYGFAGIGVNYAYNNDQANKLEDDGHKFGYIWDDSQTLPVGRFGLGTNIRLNDLLAINIEANGNIISDKFNSKKAGNPDWQFNAVVGLTINLGKKKTTAQPQPQPETKYYETKKVDTSTPVSTQNEIKEESKNVEIKNDTIKEDIFFTINSYRITTKEMDKVTVLEKYMKSHPDNKITLTGYADVKTGTHPYNMNLSKKRAMAIAKVLQNKGIDKERITVIYKGDTEQPYQENEKNRITICVVE